LAGAFMITSILLAIVSGLHSTPSSILDSPLTVPQTDGGTAPQPTAPAVPATPAEPSAPVSE
jgi:hypothetical protein